MTSLPVAIYARVSSEQQTDVHPIAPQLSALRTRVAADGFPVPEELEFIDEATVGRQESQNHQLVVKVVWNHDLAPSLGSKMRGLYRVLRLRQLSAGCRYTTALCHAQQSLPDRKEKLWLQ
jgi:hypothetical protein